MGLFLGTVYVQRLREISGRTVWSHQFSFLLGPSCLGSFRSLNSRWFEVPAQESVREDNHAEINIF
jgi:hypothetical protein